LTLVAQKLIPAWAPAAGNPSRKDGRVTERTFVVVGSVTRDTPYFQGARGKGITVFAFDEKSGNLTRLSEKGGVDNPTYLTVHEGSLCVYANSEVFGWNEGTVSAYRLEPRNGSLSYINKQPALGSILSHNSIDRTGLPCAAVLIRGVVPTPLGRRGRTPIASLRVRITDTFSSPISGSTSSWFMVSMRRRASFRRKRLSA
jgi:hypothetical protein